MNMIFTIAIVLAVLLLACAVGWIFTYVNFSARSRLAENLNAKFRTDADAKLRELSESNAAALAERDALAKQLATLKQESQNFLNDKIAAEKQLSASTERVAALTEKLEKRAEEERKLREQMTAEFENLSNRLLEASRQKMSSANLEQLSLVLNPLKSNIAEFKARVESLNVEAAKTRAGMEAQIGSLADMNAKLSKDANRLAEALQTNNKVVGNWGETILQRIFESCGFKEGIHFRTQQSFKDSSGDQTRLIPDFIVDLPDSRSIVVDSKMSLNDYVEYSAAQTQAEKRAAIEKFKKSVRAHLAEFADKYDNIPNVNCGFKLMFLPIEPAYDLIISEDNKIVFDAYESNVLIAGPSSIMAILKFAEITLRNEAIAKNTQEIANLGELLYKRVKLFSDRFTKVGDRIAQLSKEYDSASLSLTQGGKCVMSTAKRLGAKSSGDILELEEQEDNE